MFERFTEKARRVLFFARYEASQMMTKFIEAEHILLGIFREDKAIATQISIITGKSIDEIRKIVKQCTEDKEKAPTSQVDIGLSLQAKRVISLATEESVRLNHNNVTTKHLLVGILREEKNIASQILTELG